MEKAEVFVSQLCAEVIRRMVVVGVKGYHVVLKLRRRSADAALDPKKFMGCGRCDSMSK